MDDTVKLWDIRKLTGGVVKTFSDVPTHMVGELSMVKITIAVSMIRLIFYP